MPPFKVLIAEDENITTLQIKKKLLNWNFQVTGIASSGDEAVEMALNTRPDVILMDIILKGDLDGISAANIILQNFEVPIIYLTAYADEKTMDRARLTEPQNYIVKPFDDMELRFALEMISQRKKMEKKLQKTQNNLNLISEIMEDYVGRLDENANLIFVSSSIKKTLGYNPSEFSGKPIFEFIHPEDLEKDLEAFHECANNKKSIKIRSRFYNIHQNYTWIESILTPLFSDEGQFKGAIFTSRQINDQIEVEEELKYSMNYSRNLIEANLDPMVTISQGGKIMDVNQATEDATGMPRNQLIGTDFSQYFTLPEKAMRGYQKTLFYGSLKDYPLTLKHVSGKTMEVLYNATVYRDNEGKVQGVFAAARNITKIKKANEALKLSERHFRSLIENALDLILVLNKQGDITYASPSVEKTFGFKVHEILGFNILDLVFYQDIPQANEALFEKLKQSKHSIDFEIRFQNENGSGMVCKVVAQNLLKDPAVKGIILNIKDLTQHKMAEKARNDLETIYSTLLKASLDGVIAMDLEGNITHLSQKAIEILGGDKTINYHSKTIFDILSPSKHHLIKENMEKILVDGYMHNMEYNFIRTDGTKFTGEMNFALSHDYQGTPKGFISTLRDISNRKEMENQIKRSLNEKEVLLKEVHHRVKNNMQLISSLIGLQSEQMHDIKTREMFEDSKNRIKSLALIHEILYASESMEAVEFSEYIVNLIEGLKSSYSHVSKSIEIDIRAKKVLMEIDQAIPCGLIINELTSNCFKYAFTSEHDNQNFKLRINFYSIGDEIFLNVEDNGPGLPDNLDFKNTETLGLQIVCTLVAQLGGEIHLDSSNGTKFNINFKKS
ncbi:MAG: PAS domain S-box protein [Euryarchaeota archaeon]|nr:PAS domain S-box protein [Euryarchaeota archaeon]MBU4608825.1 PAS domain S-box protein [Euryarchaeota archaeon]MBV1728755.1 PAS domain S-box protein [Methanobacterium sp.]MBV1755507.1 PAS domain S-box protein [Methanobacterium sp.]